MVYRRLLQGFKQYVERVKDPVPPAERLLFTFGQPREQLQAAWRVFADSEHGGQTTAQLEPCSDEPGAATFSGRYSTELQAGGEPGEGEAAPTTLPLQRSGFCGFSSRVAGGVDEEQQSQQLMDLDDYNALLFRVRGDGRKYIANLRTDSWLVGSAAGTMRNHDVYQAFLFSRAGVWQDVEIPLSRFLLTWKGRLVGEHVAMNRRAVTSMGVSLAGGRELQPEGPFRLDVQYIKAVRRPGYL